MPILIAFVVCGCLVTRAAKKRLAPSEGLSVDESPAADELAGLRHFLKRLEAGDMKLTVNDVDGTQHEIDILKHEIARLERVIARFKFGGQDA